MPWSTIRRSSLLVAIAMVVLAPSCGPTEGDGELPLASPGLELGRDDYRTARSRFRTRLIRRGPLPTDGRSARRPSDAIELEYTAPGGKLRAYAGPTSGTGRDRPAVLFLHGGFGFTEAHWAMTRPFRDAGYVVMIPTLRGEDGQPGQFSLFLDEVDDVLAAADCLAARPDVDPARVYVAGHSVGGRWQCSRR